MKVLKILCSISHLILLILFILSAFLLWYATNGTRAQKAQMNDIGGYKPMSASAITNEKSPEESPVVINQNIADMQSHYPDVRGWLTLDNTMIDYPFVQSKDNEDYLYSDLDGNYLCSGTIFIDCRCSGIDSFVTIMYGHHMKDSSMFADLEKYSDLDFWSNNTTGTLYTPYHTYQMETVAYLVVDSEDEKIYDSNISSYTEAADFLNYIAETARHYRKVNFQARDKILILSTCNYEFTGARSVLVLKLIAD